jgi:predicted enzyme related to lactoylglutathione lyase
MPNPFIHVELQTQEPATAKAFYANLFDWRFQDVPGMDYTMIAAGGDTGAGLMRAKIPGAPARWIPFIFVDDVKAFTSRAHSLGAEVVKGPAEAPGYGWYSVLAIPPARRSGSGRPRRGRGRRCPLRTSSARWD